MSEYVLMTDSCCDLPAELAEKMGLSVLPLTFRGDSDGAKSYHDYLDGSEMSFDAFYQKMRSGEKFVTAAVNVGEFQEAMEGILQQEKDILCLCFSSALSTTYQSASIAAKELQEKYPQRNIRVIDTLSASLGQGLLIYLTWQKKCQGLTLDELAAYVEETIPHLCHWFTVNDLEYLRRGGRLSGTMALLGTMLNIKPVLHTDSEGRLTPVSKVRGRKAALNALIDKVGQLGQKLEEQTMFICQSDCLEEAQQVAQTLKQRYRVQEVIIRSIGPVIGSHTGPGTMGLFFLGSQR